LAFLCLNDFTVANFNFDECATLFALDFSLKIPMSGIVQMNQGSTITVLTEEMNHASSSTS